MKGKPAASHAFGATIKPHSFGGFLASTSTTNLSYLTPPPDLSSISDSNAIVTFKSLQKRDATTKARALDDLITYIEEHPYEQDGGVQDAVLEAWIHVYSRLSIDNSRRVRELSHTIQAALMKSARKRMEKRLTRVAAVWLAGTADRDRAVARAASEGLISILNTEAKLMQLWTKCQPQILEFALDAIRETPATLSDERSTSKDDADALYHRVMAACLSLILGLLQQLPQAEIEKHRDDYERFMDLPVVFAQSTASDAQARKLVLQLLLLCLEKYPDLISGHLDKLGKSLVPGALDISQQGSVSELIQLLIAITPLSSALWSSKKSPLKRLRKLAEKGTQGGSIGVWKQLVQLLDVVPLGEVTLEDACAYLQALAQGINGRHERRGQADVEVAWKEYLKAARLLLKHLPTASDRTELAAKYVQPITHSYIFPDDQPSIWLHIPAPPIHAQVYDVLISSDLPELVELANTEWQRLASQMISQMENSLPAVSRDFENSQRKVAETGNRWLSVQSAINSGQKENIDSEAQSKDRTDLAMEATRKILTSAIDLLKRRNFKPFGLALVLLRATTVMPSTFDPELLTSFFAMWQTDSFEETQQLLASPSAPHLIPCLTQLGPRDNDNLCAVWHQLAQALIEMEDATIKNMFIAQLLAVKGAPSWTRKNASLRHYLQQECLTTDSSSEALLQSVVASGALSDTELMFLVKRLVDSSVQTVPSIAQLRKIEILLTEKPSLILSYESIQPRLVAMLLSLLELDDQEVVTKAATIRALLDQHTNGEASISTIIQQNLDTAGPASLSVRTLLDQANHALKGGKTSIEDLLPNTNVWMSELSIFLTQHQAWSSLSLTSSLSGAYFLPQWASGAVKPKQGRDRSGKSIPARMAEYVGTLLDSSDSILETLPKVLQTELLYLLAVTAELLSDQLDLKVEGAGLWSSTLLPEEIEAASAAVSSIRTTVIKSLGVQKWQVTEQATGLLDDYMKLLVTQASHITPLALYSAKVLEALCSSIADTHGIRPFEDHLFKKFNVLQSATPNMAFVTIALLTGCGEVVNSSKSVANLLNRLVSDLSALSLQSDKTLRTLVLFNACASVFESGQLPVANHRLVLSVKQITSWLADSGDAIDANLAAEICKALARLFGCIKDVYGPYWETAVDFSIKLWRRVGESNAVDRGPSVYASLKLVSSLRSLDDANDDLLDTLKSREKDISLGILGLLQTTQTNGSQPEEIVNALISRQCQSTPLEHLQDVSDLYSLLASDSRDIQTAAYIVIQRALPAIQEKLSVDVLLDKKHARLPDELLSLLLEAPFLQNYTEEVLIQFPNSIRSYLLSWSLVFEAFKSAGDRVRNDYTDNLKAENYINDLLNFTFDFLGHSNGQAFNLTKKGFTDNHILSYDLKVGDAEEPERNMEWLLTHLFYLILKYTSGLFKTWYLDCRDKQTKIAVQSWLIKYFSPIIIKQALDEVESWSSSPDTSASAATDDRELEIKISRPAREVIASYEVDEFQGAIKLAVPDSFPLDNVVVTGVNRVAVAENKWRNWLMNTQGVIMFSNGNIIDGLTTFRRNLNGALKGQTECAICYSVIAADKKLPDKKCSTCKNLFHRHCLYKWFVSSNQNTCPLCRTPIDYLGSDKGKVGRAGGRAGGGGGGHVVDSDED